VSACCHVKVSPSNLDLNPTHHYQRSERQWGGTRRLGILRWCDQSRIVETFHPFHVNLNDTIRDTNGGYRALLMIHRRSQCIPRVTPVWTLGAHFKPFSHNLQFTLMMIHSSCNTQLSSMLMAGLRICHNKCEMTKTCLNDHFELTKALFLLLLLRALIDSK
jgi:hypothetical protein